MPSMDRIYKKDYIAQVKDHIKEIITTGKSEKSQNTLFLSQYIHQQKEYQGKQANLQIKLQ